MIRRVRLEDIDRVMEIERACFPVAWEYSIFLNICLQGGEMPSGKTGFLFMDVIEKNKVVIGYAVWETNPKKSRGHILNLAIHTDERRRGYGKMLLAHILDHLKAIGITSCILEVRVSNAPARALYESNGFVVSSRIPGYYFDEDALVYSLQL
jgi:ribosomal-protein-alanine N-acetyltransferase